MRKLLTVGILLIFLFPVLIGSARGDTVGVANSDGYMLGSDGYYWYGDNGYTRTLYQRAGYYSCGYYYPGSSYYSYSFHHAKSAYPVASVSYKDSGWRSKLLDLATARDRVEGEIRKGAFEQQYFMEAVKALGLQGNFHLNGYGAYPPYSNYALGSGDYSGSLQLSTAGVNGNSIYGYSYNSIASLYGDTNLNTLFQQANRLADRQQSLSAEATTQFNTLVGTEGQNRARVAEILAKSQAVQEMLRTIDGNSAKAETKTFTFKVTKGADGSMQLQKQDAPNGDASVNAQVYQGWVESAKKCASCHSGGEKKGGFDVATFPTLANGERLKVVSRLTTSDLTKRMPRGANNVAGVPLTAAELQYWLAVQPQGN